jgi:hypothetical protein
MGMRTELDFNFHGKWITVPVEFSYSEMMGNAIVDTATINDHEIFDQLPGEDKVFLRRQAQEDLDRLKEIHRFNREARIERERQAYLKEVREEELSSDVVGNARAGR